MKREKKLLKLKSSSAKELSFNITLSTLFFVKNSIRYFSAKKKEEKINKFFTIISTAFFTM